MARVVAPIVFLLAGAAVTESAELMRQEAVPQKVEQQQRFGGQPSIADPAAPDAALGTTRRALLAMGFPATGLPGLVTNASGSPLALASASSVVDLAGAYRRGQLAVDGGFVYAIGANQQVYRGPASGGSWEHILGCCATKIAAGGGFVYTIGTKQDVYRGPASGGSWEQVLPCCATDIALDGGFVYVVGTKQDVYRGPASGGSWERVLGCCATDVSVSGGLVYTFGINQNVYRGKGSGGDWELKLGSRFNTYVFAIGAESQQGSIIAAVFVALAAAVAVGATAKVVIRRRRREDISSYNSMLG